MFGEYIYRIRKERGYTLSQLADRVGISKSYLSNIERNIKQNPSIHIMEKIATALSIDINELLRQGSPDSENQVVDNEWAEVLKEFKKTGIHKEQLQEYKILFEFIKWYNSQR